MRKRNSKLTKMREIAVEFVETDLLPNSRDYQWDLGKLTSWGFWSEAGGEDMLIIDSLIGHQIATALLEEVKSAPEHFILELNEVFNFINPELLEGA